mgnify:CR=1 FL=1
MAKDLYKVSKLTLKGVYKKRSNKKGIIVMSIFVALIVVLSALIYFFKGCFDSFVTTGLVPAIFSFLRKYFFFSLTMQLFIRRKKVFPFIVNLIYYTFISAWLTTAGIYIAISGFVMTATEDPSMIRAASLLQGAGFIVPEVIFMTLFGWLLIQFALYIVNYKFDKALYPDIKTVKDKVKSNGKEFYKDWENKYILSLKEGNVEAFQSLISPYIERIYVAKIAKEKHKRKKNEEEAG